MTGDKYQVFYSLNNCTVPYGEWDSWRDAKIARRSAFDQNTKVRAVWTMRSNPSLNIPPARFGFVLRRTKHEAGA